jgi:hypothetical protein
MNMFISHSRADRPFADRLRKDLEALGNTVFTDSVVNAGDAWEHTLRNALEATDAVILVVPEPGARKANNAFFEAGAARALGKRVVAVLPISDESRMGELPSDFYGQQVFDGSKVAPEALANSIVTALNAA